MTESDTAKLVATIQLQGQRITKLADQLKAQAERIEQLEALARQNTLDKIGQTK